MSSWLDLFTGQWTDIWGVPAPDPREYGDYYSILVEVYRDSAPTTLVDVLNGRMSPNTLTELKGHGAGSFSISKNDAKILNDPTLLDYRNYIKIRLNGLVVGGFIIQTKKTTIIGAGEEADEHWEIAGEGPRSWVRDADVYPSKGLQKTSSETRFFNFSTEQGSWYNPANWVTPTNIAKWNSPGNWWATAPAQWPDAPNAYWVWDRSGPYQMPQGYCYFRYEFTVATAGSYSLFVAIDDSGEIYVDGELLMTTAEHAWQETNRIDFDLDVGSHVIGIKAYNYRSDAPGALMGALFRVGNGATPTAASLVSYTGQNTWKVYGYPTVEPGWTIGDIFLTLLNEAKARGIRFANNFTPMFNSVTDSNGTPWTDIIPLSFGVGSSYEEVVNAIEELGCDIWVDPDNLNLYAWKRRGSDRSLSGIMQGNLVEQRRNMIPVPLATSTSLPTGWVAAGGAASGGWVTATTPASVPYIFTSRITEAVAVGDTIYGQIQIQSDHSSISYLRVNIHSRTANNYYGGPAQVIVPVTTGVPVTVDLSLTATAALAANELDISVVPCNSSGVFVIPTSGAVFKAKSPILSRGEGNYFDGNTAAIPANQEKFLWSGAVNNSPSIRQVPENYGNAVQFIKGRNLVGADETGQAQIANTLMLRSADGWSEATAQDATSVAKYGRIETQMSTQLSASGSQPLVQEVFRQKALPELSATFDIVPVKGAIPFIDFNVGDYVTAPGSVSGSMDTRRVMSISFAEDATTNLPRYSVEFDTIFKDRQTELEKWISRVSNSSAIGGSFANSGQLPSTVITVPPAKPQGAIPDPPTGLAATSTGKYLPDGTSSSDFALTWNPVVTGSGFGALEITQYEVWGRQGTSTDPHLLVAVFDTFANLPGFNPGDSWKFSVRAISRTGGPGNFSNEITFVAAAPVQLLAKPSTPSLTANFGLIEVKWDGKLGGVTAPPYLRYVRVERKKSSDSTWVAVAALTNYSLQDAPPGPIGTSYDYRFVAVDIYGRDSTAPSDPATKVLTGVDLGDLDQQVTDAITAAQNAANAAQSTATSASIAASLAQISADAANASAAQYIRNPNFSNPQPGGADDQWVMSSGFTGGRFFPAPAGGYLVVGASADGLAYVAESASWQTALRTPKGAYATFAPGSTIKILADVTLTGGFPVTIEILQGITTNVLATQTVTVSGSVELKYTNNFSSATAYSVRIKAGPTNGTSQYVLFSNVRAYDFSDMTKVQTDVNTAITNAAAAQTSANTAQTTADGKNKVWYQNTTPPTTGNKVGDTWFDTGNNNRINQWNGTAWVNALIGSAALSDTSITSAKLADSAVTAVKIANGVVDSTKLATAVNTSITTAQSTATNAQTAATNAQTSANQAISDAAAASGIATGKADVLIQSTTPVAGMQKATTLWIDTTGNTNTPKRWSGSAWVVVTDKAATDAAAAAVAAQTTANAAQTAATAAQTSADAAANAASAAQTTANGKNKVVRSTSAANGTTGYTAGDQWWQYNGTDLIGFWIYSGSAWVSQSFASSTISNGAVDATKLAAAVNTSISNAQSTANTALTNAATAQTTADGKNKIIRSTAVASGTSYVNGDIWYQYSGTTLIGMWIFQSGAWVSQTLDNQVIANLDAGKITAGILDAARIAAKSITVDKILVGDFTNVAVGSDFEGTHPWSLGAATTIDSAQSHSGTKSLKINGTVVSGGATLLTEVLTQPGDQWYVESWVYRDATWNGTNNNSKIRIGNQSGTFIDAQTFAVIDIPTVNTWTKLSRSFTVPAGATKLTVTIVHDATAGNVWLDDIIIRRRNGGELIVDGAITTTKIAAGSITAASGIIADAAITNAKIADATITDAKIANLDAAKITTGFLAAARIQAASITGTMIAAGTVTASNMVAGTITAASGIIANAAIGSAQIIDAAITNVKIADATIQDAKIANLDAAKITTGFLSAARIAAKSITVDKVLIGNFDNLVPDAEFANPTVSGWVSPNLSIVAGGGRGSNTNALRIVGTGAQKGFYNATNIPVREGEWYRLSVWVKSSIALSAGTNFLGPYLQIDRTGSTMLTGGLNNATAISANTWTLIEQTFQIPALGYQVRVGFFAQAALTTGATLDFTEPAMTRMSDGSLVVDGSISATKILAGSITGDRLTAGTITGDRLTAGTITGDRIAAGTISTSKLLVTNQDNIVEDPSFEYSNVSGVAWTLADANVVIGTTSPRSGSRALQVTTTAAARVAATAVSAFAVEPGQQFRIGAWFQLASGTIGNTGVAVRINYGATEASTSSASSDIINIPINAAPTYQQATGVWTVPAGAKWARVCIVSRDTTAGKTYQVDDVSVYLMSDGQLIVDGAITAEKIGAQQVTADKMAAGSIAAGAIQSGAVTTDKLAAGSVTANELAVGSVNANHIVAGAIQVSHLSPSVGSSIDISANSSVNILINRADTTDANLANTNGTLNQLTTYYSFGPDGAIIGKSDSAFKLALKNDRIEISENGVVVSYWDSGRMVVPSFVGEEVVLGNHKLEKYSTGTVVRAI